MLLKVENEEESVDGSEEEQRSLLSTKAVVSDPQAPAGKEKIKLMGTAMGVYFPCLQTILGVILFLRLPYITGQAGAPLSTLIILLCASSTFLTAQSMSAIATNGKITAGGPYFLISRNLGPEFGGAIGILFYLGTSIAASLYVLGAVEAFKTGLPILAPFPMDTQLYAVTLCLTLALIVFVGVKYVNMASTFFLGCVLLSVFSIIMGVVMFSVGTWTGQQQPNAAALQHGSIADNITPHFTQDWDFRSLVALFYPSVTGIMSGANRSDVLKHPGQSIPIGTLSAILTTTTIYVCFVWLFGSAFAHTTLTDERIIITAAIGWPNRVLVIIGIIMSCVGAALQSLTGAPRLLAAIAQDELCPVLSVFATRPGQEPKTALIFTWFIASLPCLSGNLDLVTPFVTLCFLAMYTTVNFACFLLALLKEPTWRPTWNNSVPGIRRATALFGVLVCLMLMFITGVRETMFLLLMVYCLMMYIQANKRPVNWGDSMHGFRFQQALGALSRLHKADEHPKNWKPRLIVFCKCNEDGRPSEKGLNSLLFGAQMRKSRGMLMVRSIFLGDLLSKVEQARSAATHLQQNIENVGCEGFADIVVSNDFRQGILDAVQCAGLGHMAPNTVVFGLPNKRRGSDQQEMLRVWLGVVALKKALVLVKGPFPSSKLVTGRPIDVWWFVHDSGLPLLLPFLLCRHEVWSACKLRLFVLQLSDDNGDSMRHSLERHLKELRIPYAEVHVVPVPCRAVELCLLMGAEERSEQEVELTGVRFDRKRSISAVGGKLGSGARKKVANILHQQMAHHSGGAALIITNLPSLGGGGGAGHSAADAFSAIDDVVGQLGPMLLIHSVGPDVLTAQG